MPPTFHPLIFLFIYLLLPLSASSTLPSFHEAPAFRNGAACSSTSPIHIAMTLDTTTYLRGSIAAVFSVLQHSACPESIIFHFLAAGTTGDNIRRVVTSTFPYLNFHLYRFNADLVRGKISSSVRPALESPLNYARIYLADLLPYSVSRVIYLDSDLVLVDDIAKLWSIDLRRHVLGAPEYCHANFTAYFTDAFWSDPSLTSLITSTTTTTTTITTSPHPPRSSLTHRRRRKPCYFNTGVMVLDLWRWRRGGYTAKLEWWMRVQKRRRIYELGSLPPFLLVFGGDVKAVEHRWNQHGLGGDNMQGLCRDLHPGPVSLLHWSGKGKPWLRIDSKRPCPLDYLWAPYDLIHHPSLLPSVSDTW